MSEETLMRKYHYGYVHAKELLEDKFVQDLQQENKKLQDDYNAILKQRDDLTKNATEQLESVINENKQLKERIDNAIDLIKKRATDENGDIGINLYADDSYDLLSILQGKGE